MKKQYNILISERKPVPRSKRLREAGQSASSAAVSVSGNAGGAGIGNGSDTGIIEISVSIHHLWDIL